MRGIRRRELIMLLGGAAAAWPRGVCAQETRPVPRVGVLWHAANAQEEGALFSGLVEGFRALGYIDGENIILEHRFPNEMPERFTSMAAELVSLKVDVLVSSGTMLPLMRKMRPRLFPWSPCSLAIPLEPGW